VWLARSNGGVQHFLSSSGNLAGRIKHIDAPARTVAAVVPEVQKQTVAQTIIQNPVVERIIERERVVAGNGCLKRSHTSMGELENRLRTLVLASAGTHRRTSALYK